MSSRGRPANSRDVSARREAGIRLSRAGLRTLAAAGNVLAADLHAVAESDLGRLVLSDKDRAAVALAKRRQRQRRMDTGVPTLVRELKELGWRLSYVGVRQLAAVT